jgi:hypothetical protein
MDVLAPLIADREPAVLRKPQASVRSTTHLSRPSFSLLCMPFLAIRCYRALYPTFPQSPFALLLVVSFVALSLCRFVALSLCRFVALSLCRFVALSLWRFVGMQLLGFSGRFLGLPLPGPGRLMGGLYGVDELLEEHRVVGIGGGEDRGERDPERDPFSVRNKVALRALLSLIRRIRCGFCAPPFLAPLLAPFFRVCSLNPQRHAPSR